MKRGVQKKRSWKRSSFPSGWSFCRGFTLVIIIIMYIYHALINALSAHTIHINLNTIFCAHVEHSLTKTIYIWYYTETDTHTRTHNDYSRNLVLILVGVEIRWKEEGYIYFKTSKWKQKSLKLCTVCHCFAHSILIESGGQVSYCFSFFYVCSFICA